MNFKRGCHCKDSEAQRYHFTPQMYWEVKKGFNCLTLQEVRDFQPKNPHCCEYLNRNDAFVKPYFDFDCKFDTEAEMPKEQETLDAILISLQDSIAMIFENDSSNYEIFSAWRKPAFAAGSKKWKISYRFFVHGLKTTKKALEALVSADPFSREGLPECVALQFPQDGEHHLFDTKVYKTNHKMNYIFSSKDDDTKRVLEPIDFDDEKNFAEYYTIQHVLADWPAAAFKCNTTEKEKKIKKTKAKANQKTVKENEKAVIAFIEEMTGMAVARAVPNVTGCYLMEKRFCPFLQREHESNNVYAHITPEGLKLRCSDCNKMQLVCGFTKLPDIVAEKTEDIKFDNDLSLGALAFRKLKDIVKKPQLGSNEYYIFNEDLCLWQKWKEVTLRRLVMDTLTAELTCYADVIDARMAKAKDDPVKLEILEDVTDALQMKIKYVGHTAGATSILASHSELFMDLKFESKLDATPYLIAFNNGVVDIRTDDLRPRPRTPEDRIYQVIDRDFQPDLDFRWFEETVIGMMADDEEMADYLLRSIGYAFTGYTNEEIFCIWFGKTANGKGMLTTALKAILGNFMTAMEIGLILEEKISNEAAEVGKLQGKRLALWNETEVKKLRSSKVKAFTGGDVLPARHLYGDPIDLVNHAKCLLTTNRLPDLDEYDDAVARRMVVIDFPVTFEHLKKGEEESKYTRRRDDSLKERVKTDDSVVTCFVHYARKWFMTQDLQGNKPAKVTAATQKFMKEGDRIQKFIDETCEIGQSKEFRIKDSVLWNSFMNWNRGSNFKLTQSKFYEQVEAKGFVKKKQRISGYINSTMGFEGIRLIEEGED